LKRWTWVTWLDLSEMEVKKNGEVAGHENPPLPMVFVKD